jgi:hypothetical protein
MDRRGRGSIAVGAILVVAGILFAALPKDWLEQRFGFEPDGGNGFVELLMVLVPIVIGAVLIARGVRSWRRDAGRARSVVPTPPTAG